MKKLKEPTKQKCRNGLAGMLSTIIRTATACKRLFTSTLFFSLLMLLVMALSPSAFAQTPTSNVSTFAGTVMTPDPMATPSGARGVTGGSAGGSTGGSTGSNGPKGYFQRFPYAAAAQKADTLKQNSSGVYASQPGVNSPPQFAYAPIAVPDMLGTGIAYMQLPMFAIDKPAAARDSELFQNLMTTYGYPMSDSQFQIIQRENNQRLLELAFDPERAMWMSSATSQTTASSASKAMANTGELALNAVFQYIVYGDGTGSLINVANEGAVAGLAYSGNGNDISIAQAVYMVQTMYKQVFIPMAVLFLLPGAVISQVKSITAKGFGMQATESQSPFDGILRSIVAVFLIPSTQVIMSWAIDTGNSLAYSCQDWVDLPTITNWTQQLCYGPQLTANAMAPPNPAGSSTSGSSAVGTAVSGAIGGTAGAIIGGAIDSILGTSGIGDGLAANQPESTSVLESQDWMGQALQTTLNGAMLMAAITLIILGALQAVTMCYLFLLGPISAAFYAWPQVSSSHLFRGVFGKWVDGVIKLSMWRFVWMAVLAIMTQRIQYMGGTITDLRWEVAVFICFLGLMVGVPASPFTFQPFAVFQSARQLQSQSAYAQQGMGPPSQQGGGQQGGGQTQQGGGQPSQQGGGQPSQQGGGQQVGQGGQQSGADSGTNTPNTPTNAGGSSPNNTKDAPPPPSSQPSHSAQPGTPAAPAGGSPTGSPPPGGGSPAATATNAAATSSSAAAPNGGATPSGGGGGTPSNGTMPTGSPATPMTPSGAATPGSPTTSTNPGATPAAPAAPAAAAAPAAPADGGGDADKGDTDKASAKGKAAPAAAAPAGAVSTGAVTGQVASAAAGANPPPPAKNQDA